MTTKTETPTEVPWYIRGSIVLLLTLTIAFAYSAISKHKRLADTTATLEDVVSSKDVWMDRCIRAETKGKTAQLKYLNLQASLAQADENVVTDEVVVKWSYANAASFVPISEIKPIVAECKRYRNYLMLLAVFREESRFNQYGRSDKGAKGLGQIITKTTNNPKWPGWLPKLIEEGIFEEEIDVFDISKNIRATDYILNTYYEEAGSWRKALSKYVNGDSAYVTRVLSNFAELTLLLTEENDAGNTKISTRRSGHRDGKPTVANAAGLEDKKVLSPN